MPLCLTRHLLLLGTWACYVKITGHYDAIVQPCLKKANPGKMMLLLCQY